MKTLGVIVCLIVFLLVLASPWTVPSVATQQLRLSPASIRAWALINFDAVDTVGAAAQLWNDAGYVNEPGKRWNKIPDVSARPKAAILSISVVRVVGAQDTMVLSKQRKLESWDAIALIRAADQAALVSVEQYIEDNFSHVDMYRIHEGQ